MRPSWDKTFCQIAQIIAQRATCPKAHVGAVLVTPDHRVISVGYNGAPKGSPHCDDVGCLTVQGKCRRAVHAEVNVLTQAGVAAKGATLYVTKRPCLYCASVAVNAGIARVVYITDHHPDVYQLDALELLRSSGIEVVHSPMNITDCLAKEQEDVF